MIEISLKMNGLNNLIKTFSGKLPSIKVGVLGDQSRSDGPTNATVGAVHEFGTSKVPMRSFIRMPLSMNLVKNLESAGAFSERAFESVLKDGSLKPWIEKIAIEAVGTIMDAFDTEGFGTWAPLNPATMEAKKVKQILTETQQLRNSITYEIG